MKFSSVEKALDTYILPEQEKTSVLVLRIQMLCPMNLGIKFSFNFIYFLERVFCRVLLPCLQILTTESGLKKFVLSRTKHTITQIARQLVKKVVSHLLSAWKT